MKGAISMISRETFSDENIKRICEKYKTPYDLTQRSIYALGLIEALKKVGLDLVFKGGSSLMLLFKTPKRLSTDADILVSPDCDIDSYVKKAAKIFPFISCDESIRKSSKSISKKHFKFHYQSTNSDKTFTILLDVLFADNKYVETLDVFINNDFLIDDGTGPLRVKVPTPESLLGDKLTAFAPHTTGINFFNEDFSNDKRLEVIKQFYDVATLFDVCHNFKEVRETYLKIVRQEIEYRDGKYKIEECLLDSFNAALSIISLGKFMSEDYHNYVEGFKRISGHIVGFRLNSNNAYPFAAKIMLLSVSILKNVDPFIVETISNNPIAEPPYNQINRLLKVDSQAFGIASAAIELLNNKKTII